LLPKRSPLGTYLMIFNFNFEYFAWSCKISRENYTRNCT
jgi:hypothetical protein